MSLWLRGDLTFTINICIHIYIHIYTHTHVTSLAAAKHRTGYHSGSITSRRARTNSTVHRSSNSCGCCTKRSLYQEWLCEGQQQLPSLLLLWKRQWAIHNQSIQLSCWHCLWYHNQRMQLPRGSPVLIICIHFLYLYTPRENKLF
jgi:hypothetical protein